MADTRKFVTAAAKTLSTSVTSTATTVPLSDLNSRAGDALTMTDFGTLGLATIDPNGTSMELISFTGISSTSLTGVTRGLAFEAPYTTVAGLKKAHAAGTKLVFSNPSQLYDQFVNKGNDETITGDVIFQGAMTVDSTASNIPIFDANPTLTDDKHVATKKYADDLAIAGSPDATTTVKGIVEEATDAELAAGTAAGGTSARLFAGGASHNETAAAGKVPVAEATGKLGEDWLGLSAAGDLVQSDGTDLQRLAVTANQYVKGNAGGTAVEYGGANLDEADTFFGVSTMTGAQSNTLIDGSSGDSLHIHGNYELNAAEQDTATHITVPFLLHTEEWEENITGGQIARGAAGTLIEAGNTDGNDAILYSTNIASNGNLSSLPEFLLSSDASMKITIATDVLTAQDLYWGFNGGSAAVEADAVLVTDHCGFFVADGVLWASSADGTTQERTDVTGALVLTNRNVYELIHTAGGTDVFKVNGATVATHSTNIADDGPISIRLGASTTANAYKGFVALTNAVIKVELP